MPAHMDMRRWGFVEVDSKIHVSIHLFLIFTWLLNSPMRLSIRLDVSFCDLSNIVSPWTLDPSNFALAQPPFIRSFIHPSFLILVNVNLL